MGGCDNNMRCGAGDYVNREARSLAHMLDQGRGEEVANRLHRDAYNMDHHDFKRLVRQTADMERKGRGDDLHLDRRGQVRIATRDGGLYPCDIYEDRVVPKPQIIVERPVIIQERPPVVMHPQPGQAPPYYENYPPQPPQRNTTLEGGLLGGVIGAGIGAIADHKNRGRGAAIGGAAGALGGILGGSLERR
ncbi:MAG: hypothetical protein K2X77_27070 [Candidatus Obscuribacterales bacterium]|jgi:hypothetical protein|nr:hypothetical protein [Candidatus Obscuribacterales bacterium]